MSKRPVTFPTTLLAVFLVLGLAATAQANPCIQDPSQIAASIIVIIAALLLEVFVTTGLLLFSGIAVVPTFFPLLVGNAVSYLGILLPLFGATKSVWLVEVVVIGAEALFIKLLTRFDVFQGDSFQGLKWRYAFLCVFVGNACSYYVGVRLARAPQRLF